MSDFIVTFVTASSEEEARKIASALVESRLAACVSIVPCVNSIYRWEKKICDDKESLLIIKSRRELFSRIEEKVKSLHGYKVPEVIALPILTGSGDYLAWLKNETDD